MGKREAGKGKSERGCFSFRCFPDKILINVPAPRHIFEAFPDRPIALFSVFLAWFRCCQVDFPFGKVAVDERAWSQAG
jgi:hypothetical protein